MPERERRKEGRMRREEKWQTCLCSGEQRRVCIMAQVLAEKLHNNWPAQYEKKEWAQHHIVSY